MHRDRIIAAARARLGVRWRHQGRSARTGLDCIGLLVDVANELGLPHEDLRVYSRTAQGADFLERFRAQLTEIRLKDAGPGDVAVMVWGPYPCHCGFVSERFGRPHIIHAAALRHAVVEEPLGDDLRGRWHWAFRLSGVV